MRARKREEGRSISLLHGKKYIWVFTVCGAFTSSMIIFTKIFSQSNNSRKTSLESHFGAACCLCHPKLKISFFI